MPWKCLWKTISLNVVLKILYLPEMNEKLILVEDNIQCFETNPAIVECFNANPVQSTSSYNLIECNQFNDNIGPSTTALDLIDGNLNQIRYVFESDDSIADLEYFTDIGTSSDESDDQETGPYATDEDEKYTPSDTLSTSDTEEDENSNGSVCSSTHSDTRDDAHVTPVKARKRQKRPSEWKIKQRKRLRTQDKPKVAESKVQLAVHQRRAEKAVTVKKNDIEKHIFSGDTVVVYFDLQQSLPMPLLTTSKVFYLRQLWTYNFCFYDLINNEANMYVWSEDIASRGSQEIESCLIRFNRSLPPNVKRMIAYSDSREGQSRNKNISKLYVFGESHTT
ncbi:unnamed protein product [Psylliodes chrysocephalus]|uniref:Uncharacterized protein n=1 Tax=Psylliodes chrysocephalus TaxID=3402493 RepID=A0A9P0GB16_9CUCU|nr:unnamed protein product [Psylliodes chrysocephala]